jgi:hypothetical protein
MKIGGREVKGLTEEILVLPRLDGDVVFRARAVSDMKTFNKMCPMPKAPSMLVAGGFQSNVKDAGYLAQLNRHSELRLAYLMIKSLEPTGIEWDTVKMDDPNTWSNWEIDLSSAGFTDVEIQRVTVCVMQANSLDEGKLARAREAFLLGQGMSAQFSGPSTEPGSMPSGEPASDSE